jgi:hypothetical protein
MPRASTTLFQDAIDVPRWLESERLTPYGERVRRDRAIARELRQSAAASRVRAWWRHAARDVEPGDGARLDRLRALVTVAMAVAGILVGVMAALAAFSYDGSQPVNVVRLLALLVGAQLVLLALTLLLLLLGRVPGLRHVQDLFAAVNPGAWAAAVFRKLSHAPLEVTQLFDPHSRRASAVRFAKWQALYWSQTAAVAFNIAALVTAIMLVTFSDLAFGWSTTLEADPADVNRIVRAIARPWAAVAPAAVPSEALVEQSQFFRLGDAAAASSPRSLGAWWPFTILSLITYGLVPRVALLAFAATRLRAATKVLLLGHPAVTALLDRMASPVIETEAAEHDSAAPPSSGSAAGPPRPITGSASAVIWERSVPVASVRDYARAHLALDVTSVGEAGGGKLAADGATLERLASDAPDTLLVLTPAWEPPLLELLDFLAEIRRRVGASASIIVVPVPDGARAVSDVERATWTRAIGRLRDPKLYVEAGAA